MPSEMTALKAVHYGVDAGIKNNQNGRNAMMNLCEIYSTSESQKVD